jgi:hypothetical protein
MTDFLLMVGGAVFAMCISGIINYKKIVWKNLTDEELDRCYDNVEWNTIDWCPDHQQLARAVEAKLKEKNT